VRYGVLAYLCTLAFVLYLDRVCISKAAPDLMAELDISYGQMGYVFGAFTLAYGLFEVPVGRWGDRFGSRGVLIRIVLWWSAFTVLTGCVWPFALDTGWRLPGLGVPLVFNSFALLLLVRFLFGAGEAGALPNSARVIARWFPQGRRGPAQAAINAAMLVGGALAPIIAAYLIQSAGWRLSFLLFGALGVIWAVAFWAWFRDDPADHPAVNEAELRLIQGKPDHDTPPSEHPQVPWRMVLGSPTVLLLGGIMSTTAFTAYMYFFWYPTYLQSARNASNLEAGWLAGLVLAGGSIGCILGGYVGDWLVRRTGEQRWTRRCLGFVGLASAALLLVSSIHCNDPLAAVALTALASFSAYLTLPNWWAVVTEISGEHLGALFGLLNSLGVPGAFLSSVFLGWFADWRNSQGFTGRDQWDSAFYAYAGALLCGACAWLLVDPSRSVVDAKNKGG
jgi:MFS family permease